MADIAIVGAGLIGRLLAVELAPYANVHLFEQRTLNDANTTGQVAAGMLGPMAESVIASDALVNMGVTSLALWRRLVERHKRPDLFQQAGTIVVSHRQDQAVLEHPTEALQG